MDLNPLLVFNAPSPYGVSDKLKRGGGGEINFPQNQGARIFAQSDGEITPMKFSFPLQTRWWFTARIKWVN